jgi:hypothetical protein
LTQIERTDHVRPMGGWLAPLFAWAFRKSRVGLAVVGALPGTDQARWAQPRLLPIGIPTDATQPRQADLLVIVGLMSQKLAPFLVRTHAAMARPAQVLVVELEPGGPLRTYATLNNISSILPVDVVLRDAQPRQELVTRAMQALDTSWATRQAGANG